MHARTRAHTCVQRHWRAHQHLTRTTTKRTNARARRARGEGDDGDIEQDGEREEGGAEEQWLGQGEDGEGGEGGGQADGAGEDGGARAVAVMEQAAEDAYGRAGAGYRDKDVGLVWREVQGALQPRVDGRPPVDDAGAGEADDDGGEQQERADALDRRR